MPAVMTTGGKISCPSEGKATLSSGAKLKAGGNPVLLVPDATTWVIGGCKNGSTPCTAISAVLAGSSTKLKVNGSPVLLQGAKGTTNGTDAAFTADDAGQTKLTSA